MSKSKFMVGDMVKCVSEGDGGPTNGFGWKKDLVFEVKKITEDYASTSYIYWEGHLKAGVFEDYLILNRNNKWKGDKKYVSKKKG